MAPRRARCGGALTCASRSSAPASSALRPRGGSRATATTSPSSTATTASRSRRASPTARSFRTATWRRSPVPACCRRSRRGSCAATRRCASTRSSIPTSGAGCCASCSRARDAERGDDAAAARAVVLQPRADARARRRTRRSSSGTARNGKLVVHSDEEGYASARALVDYQRSLGCEQDALDRDACLALEPALGAGGDGLGARLAGGIHTPSEEVGDCYRFCVGLERHLMATRARALRARDAGAAPRRRARPRRRRRHGVGTARRRCVRRRGGLGVRAPGEAARACACRSTRSRATASRCRCTGRAARLGHRRRAQGRLRAARRPDGRDAARRRHGGHRRLVAAIPIRCACASSSPRRARHSRTRPTTTRRSTTMAPWCGLRPATPLGSPILGATPIANLSPQRRARRARLDAGAGERPRRRRRDRRPPVRDSPRRLRVPPLDSLAMRVASATLAFVLSAAIAATAAAQQAKGSLEANGQRATLTHAIAVEVDSATEPGYLDVIVVLSDRRRQDDSRPLHERLQPCAPSPRLGRGRAARRRAGERRLDRRLRPAPVLVPGARPEHEPAHVPADGGDDRSCGRGTRGRDLPRTSARARARRSSTR